MVFSLRKISCEVLDKMALMVVFMYVPTMSIKPGAPVLPPLDYAEDTMGEIAQITEFGGTMGNSRHHL